MYRSLIIFNAAIISLFIPLAYTALLPLENNSNLAFNLTFDSSSNEEPQRTCVEDVDWNPPNHYLAAECETAIEELYLTYTQYCAGNAVFVFRSRSDGSSYIEFQKTDTKFSLPKFVTRGQCTIAFTSMKIFENRGIKVQWPNLPADRSQGRKGSWPGIDHVNWHEAIGQADRIRSECKDGSGYVLLGRRLGIGIALWKTGSERDRWLRLAKRTFGETLDIGGPNSTQVII